MAAPSSAAEVDEPQAWQPPDSDAPVQSWTPPQSDAPVAQSWTPPESDAPVSKLKSDGIQNVEGAVDAIHQKYDSAIQMASESNPAGVPKLEAMRDAEIKSAGLQPVDALGSDVGPIVPSPTAAGVGKLTGLSPTGRPAKILAAAAGVPGQIINALVKPENAIAFTPPGAAAFIAQMAASVPQQLATAAGSYSGGDTDAGDASLVQGLVTAGLLGLPALHAIKAGKSLDDIVGQPTADALRENAQKQNEATPPVQPDEAQNAAPAPVQPIAPPEAQIAAPKVKATDAGIPEQAGEDQPVLQPAIKYDGKILTGGGNGHIGVVMSHASEFPQLPSDFMGAANEMSGFVDNDGNFYNRNEAAKALGSPTPMTSEDLPNFDANAEPPEKQVMPFKSVKPSGGDIGKEIGAKFDGQFDLGTGPYKQFTFTGENFEGDQNTPHYGTTFQMPADATLEDAKAKAQEVKNRFSNQGKYTLKIEGGKFNIYNPSNKIEESFTNPNEAIEALGEYNTPSPEARPQIESPTTRTGAENAKNVAKPGSEEPKASPQSSKPFEVDEQLLAHSPHTDEDFEVSYRGKPSEGQAVVWTGKTQMQIPESWLRRKGEKYVKPSEISKASNVGNETPPVNVGKADKPTGNRTVEPASPETLSKAELVDEYAGAMPSDYSSKVKWENSRKAFGRFTKQELVSRVTNQRKSDADFKELQEQTSKEFPAIDESAKVAGNKWKTFIQEKAKQEGVTVPNLQGERSDAVYSLARNIASKKIKSGEYEKSNTPPQSPLVGLGAAVPSEFSRGQGNPTAMKYKLIDQERQQRGLPPITKPESISDQAVMDKATAEIDKNPELPDQLVKELNSKPRSIDAWERMVLLLHKIDLRDQYEKSAREAAQAFDDSKQFPDRADDMRAANIRTAAISDKLNDLENASRVSGSEQGRGLRALQIMANEDYSLAGLETRARASKGGEPLTDSERSNLVKITDEYKKANDALTQHLADARQKNSELEATKAINEIKKSETPVDPRIKPIVDRVIAAISNQAKSARERIAARQREGRLSAGLDPADLADHAIVGAEYIAKGVKNVAEWNAAMLKEFGDYLKPHLKAVLDAASKYADKMSDSASPAGLAGKVKRALKDMTPEEQKAHYNDQISEKLKAGKKDEITSQVKKLARLFVKQGITDRDALIDAVHNEIKKSDPNITRRDTMDAISGYGDFKQLTKDEVSVKLRGLKGEMQQVAKLEDIQAKKPPLKSGVERRTPSDEERKLIKQVNEAKRQHGIVVTDPATQLKSALEARKTYYKNQIADLEKQISDREKFVKSKTPSPTDSELEALKARRKELKGQFDDLFNPKKTDAEKYQDSLAVEKKQLEKSIAVKQRKLKEGDLGGPPKEMNRPADPTLEPLKQQRDALNKELSKARAEAAKKPESQKYAEALQRRLEAMNKSIAEKEARIKSGNVEPNRVVQQNRPLSPELEQAKQKLDALNKQIEELRNPKKTDVEKLRDRIQKSIKTMEDKIASGDFSKAPKKTPLVDRKVQELTAQKEQVAKKFKKMQRDFEKSQLPKSSKALDFISNLRRFSVLSGVNVLGKLGAYSATKLPTIGATEAIGGAISKLPKLSEIAAKAPSEGGLSVRALATATAKGLTKGFMDAFQTATKGQSDLRAAFSNRPESGREWHSFFQTVHEVIKSPLRRAAFELSLAKRMEFAAKNGADIRDPIVQLGLAKDAYLDSDRALLLENNRFANGIRVLMRNLEAKDKNTGRPSLGGKIGATVGRVEFPILSVPLNYVKQTLTSAFGLVSGSIKARAAFKNGIDKLSPQEADAIIRHLKYGTIGGAALLYGFYDGYKNQGNGTLGGFYQPGEKRKDNQAGVGGVRIAGHNLPGLLFHNPVIAVAQLGHTMGAILASKINKKSDQTHSVPVAVAASMMGLLNQSPLGPTTELISQLSDPRSAEWAMGEHVKGLVVPQLVQETANLSDHDASGNVIKRKPETIMQHVATGIPGLRQTVPTQSTSPGRFKLLK